MITEQEIARINALAQKSRTPEGLTEDEKAEQARLRRAYIDSFKQSLCAQLDHTYIVDEKGNKTPLTRKPKNERSTPCTSPKTSRN